MVPDDAPDNTDVIARRETVEPSGNAPHAQSTHYAYTPWYTGWNVHPYYRNQHQTSAVWYYGNGYYPDPWGPTWEPASRHGWVWVSGYYDYGYWHPGYWTPQRHIAPRQGYVWSNGFWQQNNVYVDGYWRAEERDDGDWQWVEGYYLADGSYVPGHWRPTEEGPEGYGWEPGFWKGDAYVDGFWRPEYRTGFTWQSAYYDAEGVFYGGFWIPVDDVAGFVWVPGWFDGTVWINGYWVNNSEFSKEVVSIELGEGIGDGEVIENRSIPEEELDSSEASEKADPVPLGLPATFE